jgi:hypothetical protein
VYEARKTMESWIIGEKYCTEEMCRIYGKTFADSVEHSTYPEADSGLAVK